MKGGLAAEKFGAFPDSHPCGFPLVQANAQEPSTWGTAATNPPKYASDRIFVKFKSTGLGPQAVAAARARSVRLSKGVSVVDAVKAYQGRAGE